MTFAFSLMKNTSSPRRCQTCIFDIPGDHTSHQPCKSQTSGLLRENQHLGALRPSPRDSSSGPAPPYICRHIQHPGIIAPEAAASFNARAENPAGAAADPERDQRHPYSVHIIHSASLNFASVDFSPAAWRARQGGPPRTDRIAAPSPPARLGTSGCPHASGNSEHLHSRKTNSGLAYTAASSHPCGQWTTAASADQRTADGLSQILDTRR